MTTQRRGGDQPLTAFLDELALPSDFGERAPVTTDLAVRAIEWLADLRPTSQNHWPALVFSLVAQAEALLALEQVDSIASVFDAHPPESHAPGGKAVNTLNFTREGAPSVKLRPLYNAALFVIRNMMLRDHPSNAPHATQSWPAYRELIALIYTMSPAERLLLAEYVWLEGVLTRPERQMATVTERVVRPFEHALKEMPTTAPGVRGGALLQALAFGYLRADSPNLILESHSVNTGSSRAGMLGDVDGFRGSEPELAAEVKDLHINSENVDGQLSDFLEDVAIAPNATAVVICRSISDDARRIVERHNVTVLTVEDLERTVSVWDLPKQQEALRGVEYYLGRVQRSSPAEVFFRQWLDDNDLDGGLSPRSRQ